MTGAEAIAAFDQAKALVKAGRYDDALSVPMLLASDRTVIEARIAQAKNASCANTTKEKQ